MIAVYDEWENDLTENFGFTEPTRSWVRIRSSHPADIARGYAEAVKLLQRHRAKLDALIDGLVEERVGVEKAMIEAKWDLWADQRGLDLPEHDTHEDEYHRWKEPAA